jgi:hypothetical protein
VALALVVLSACTPIERAIGSKTGVYATLDEARAAGAIDGGWVPQGLPPGTSDLRVAYLSDGTQWGIFAFPPAQGDGLRSLLGDEITSNIAHCTAPGRFEWWPHVLRDPIDLNTVHATGLRLYAARDGRRTFAVNWNQGRAYYWRE